MYPRQDFKLLLGRGLGGPRGSSVVPEATSILSKLISWHAFEDDVLDSWGVYPLTESASGITYADTSTGGTGLTGRCVSAGRARSFNAFPYDAATGQHVTAIAMVSTSAFNNTFPVINIQDTSSQGGILDLTETTDTWRFKGTTTLLAVTGSVFAPASRPVDAWNLVGYSTRSGDTAYIHHNGTHRLSSAAVGTLLLPSRLLVGTSSVATSSKIAFMATMQGEPTASEWAYLYNSGAGRTLAEIISDAEYTAPTIKYGGTGTTTAEQATSVPGNYIARIAAASAVSSYNFCNTYKTTGKHWDAFTLKHAGAWTQVAYAGYTSAAFGVYGMVGFSHANTVSGNMTAGTGVVWTAGAQGDTFMRAVDYDAGKIWFGKNGTWSGDPSAGTGWAYSFTPNTSLTAFFNLRDPTGLRIYMTTGEMPYSNPTGFTPWGD